MARLRIAFAVGIGGAWLFVVFSAVRNPELVGLATIVTPVVLLPAGWLFTDVYLKSKRGDRD